MVKEEVKEPEKKEVKEKYSMGNVVTGTAEAVIVDGEALTIEEALVIILNKLDKIERSIA